MNSINLGNMEIPVIKPKKGVDYYTEAEKEELIQETTTKVYQIIEPKELERQTSEATRKLNENDRKTQESTREASESERKVNEDTRQNNETTRQTNEQSRIEAEQSRNTAFTTQMTENEKAIQNVKDKTEEYNSNAETKTNEFNLNAEQKTQTFNENANTKLQEINQIKDTTEAQIAVIKEKDTTQDTKIGALELDNETNKQDILDLQDKNTEQDKTLEALQKENIELKAENERLNNDINAISVTEKAEGENITLNNTAEARFKSFGIGGNSWQETGDVTDEEGNVVGTMPRPGFESDIRNCGDNVNLYDGNKVNYSSGTYNGQLCTDKNSIWYRNVDISKLKFPLTFSSDITVNNNNYTSSNIRVSLRNANKEQIKMIEGSNATASNKKSSLTILSDDITDEVKYIYLSVRIQDGGYTENTKIEQGTKATSYSTYGQGNANFRITNGLENTDTNYKEQSFTFPLAKGQRLMKGDYLADDGIHHKRKQIVLDGTENWIWGDTTRYALSLENIGGIDAICSHYIYKKYTGSTLSTDKTFCVSDNFTYIGFFDTEITSLTKWKEYLAEQYANGTPVVVEYDLAEEEIEPYIPEQQTVHDEIKKIAHSYGEQTHIFSTDEISPIFTVEARKDMNTVISNLESMILANASEEV